MTTIDTLIVVACHAIYLDGPNHGHLESEWLIEPFQAGETPTFADHIRCGIQELAKTRGTGVLVFSGGATKLSKTDGRVQKTEADSYMDFAIQNGCFSLNGADSSGPESLQSSTFAERYATDSYQNVLLSLIQYSIWLRQQRYRGNRTHQPNPVAHVKLALPKRLTVVSHEFKRARFTELHLPAIRSIWPSETLFDEMEIDFIGINPPFDEAKMEAIAEGDRKRGYGVWKDDLFGNGELLSGKRRDRGWDEGAFLNAMRSEFDSTGLATIQNLLQGVKELHVKDTTHVELS